MKVMQLFYLSRPRFWIYLLGPYLIGIVSAGDPLLHDRNNLFILAILFLFFTFPANIMIYGINDIFDYETDKHNPKKNGYEQLVSPNEQKVIWKVILLATLPFLPIFFFLNFYTSITLIVFFFTGIYYSSPPIRAKSRPPLDVLFSSIIYVSPAIIGFFASGNISITWQAIVGGLLWASAMQTFSAIPDIESDKKASIKTLATMLGEQLALWFCFISWLGSGAIAYLYLGIFSIFISLVYLGIAAYTLSNPKNSFIVYKKFPMVNAFMGMLLFFLIVSKFWASK